MYTILFIFFFNDTATTEIYTLSLHDALPISERRRQHHRRVRRCRQPGQLVHRADGEAIETERQDRKSTRLNSSHPSISYAVFCLKKKKKSTKTHHRHKSTFMHLNTADYLIAT